ncbi:hypothetical protein ABZ128_31245 [Streptomyces sp. NPDC006326]|uniref:hypothetical protein n=1 Tax=Streptomyces sp. NPDC006326 TaxID=3156752 RepID=UPI0033A32BCE
MTKREAPKDKAEKLKERAKQILQELREETTELDTRPSGSAPGTRTPRTRTQGAGGAGRPAGEAR